VQPALSNRLVDKRFLRWGYMHFHKSSVGT
jgi:hypothetical protein